MPRTTTKINRRKTTMKQWSIDWNDECAYSLIVYRHTHMHESSSQCGNWNSLTGMARPTNIGI